MAKVVAQDNDTATMDEQVRQCKIIAKAMLAAVKHYCPDFIVPGKSADPAPSLIAETKHILPNNDLAEHDAGLLDLYKHKNRKQTIERTDAKIKIKGNNTMEFLQSLPVKQRAEAWKNAGKELRPRLALDKERRAEMEQKRMDNALEKERKGEKKTKKKEKKGEEFKAVMLARTVEDLDSLLNGLGEKLGRDVILKQMEQWKTVYGVTTHMLPKSTNGRPLQFAELYANLRALLAEGDPMAPETAERLKAKRKKRPGRRPSSTYAERQSKKRKIDE